MFGNTEIETTESNLKDITSIEHNYKLVDTKEKRKELIQSALGKIPLDLIIKNVQVVNVYTGTIDSGEIGIKSGRGE